MQFQGIVGAYSSKELQGLQFKRFKPALVLGLRSTAISKKLPIHNFFNLRRPFEIMALNNTPYQSTFQVPINLINDLYFFNPLVSFSHSSPNTDQNPRQFQRNCWIPILTIQAVRYKNGMEYATCKKYWISKIEASLLVSDKNHSVSLLSLHLSLSLPLSPFSPFQKV
jgi:hypothetical protein